MPIGNILHTHSHSRTHRRTRTHTHTLPTRHDTATGDRHGGVGKQHQRAHAQTHTHTLRAADTRDNNTKTTATLVGWLADCFFFSLLQLAAV